MSDGILGGRWKFGELLAVTWNDEMDQRFPDASHDGCRMDCRDPDRPVCAGWHCNRCGAPTNAWGHHDCPDRPARGGAA
jgi:hypothetical protein